MNGPKLILLPIVDSKENYLSGFWQWVELLAKDDYQSAIKALYWEHRTPSHPEDLKKRITTFFGGNQPWKVVIPNNRLIKVINDSFEYQARNGGKTGWFRGLIPLTNSSVDPKRDDIPLMGLAASFFVQEHQNHHVMEFEIFHV